MPVTIEGVVEAVSVKERKTKFGQKNATSFKINGLWLSGGFKEYDIDKGDEVSCTYETNDAGYHDVTGIAVTAKGAAPPTANTGVPRPGRTFPIDPLAPERTINRQNALTAAVNAFGEMDGSVVASDYREAVVNMARYFESYTCGDLDREEALAIVAAQDK